MTRAADPHGLSPRAYLAVYNIALRQRLRESLLLFSRAAFLVLMMLVFSRLWSAVLPAQGGRGETNPIDNVWYLLITECVLLSQPRIWLDIERDVRSGELAYHLTRPASYLGFKLAEGFAEISLTLLVLLSIGAPAAYLLAGSLPGDPRGLWLALPLVLLASLLMLLCNALIGFSSFWIVDSSPLQWFWQKSSFVLGGLFVPLTLYPTWLRGIAEATPFAALLNGPGSMAFGLDLARAQHAVLQLCTWITIASVALFVVQRRGLRILDLHGG